MSQTQEEVVNLIQSIISSSGDNTARKQNEVYLKTFRENSSNDFIVLLLNLLKSSEKIELRTFAASQIRKNLSNFSEKSFKNLWENLQPETQTLVKTSLFQCLENEPTQNIRHLICDAIGEIGGSLLEDSEKEKGNRWPELINILWQLFMQERNPLIEGGFKILASLLSFCSDTFEKHKSELHTLFKNGMANADKMIKLSAIQALGSHVEVLEPKECKVYEDLIPVLLDSTLNLLI